ncbi:unnamed protein product [Phytophthora lilii]|uniref:mannan endo-1,4-beta-mannosidase n=1 Tax=Phytophthora lilii TaxID=2077276 RepID=A0A9W7CPE0_9STRA|nr:unnamed protein product [Phytophthora lilii]
MKVFTTTAALLASLAAHSLADANDEPSSDGRCCLCEQSKTDLATIFNTMADSGLTVCRTWGFADLKEAGTAPYNIVYQLWENGKPTVNTGDNGLGYFDLVVAAAKAAGVKLVVPFVNNWSDYGGMGALPFAVHAWRPVAHLLFIVDVYVQQLGGTYHDDFYTDETIKAAYKNFVKTFVERYADEETIMAWELCNECRCAGSGTLKESGSCNTTTLTDWMTEMSSVSLDRCACILFGTSI